MSEEAESADPYALVIKERALLAEYALFMKQELPGLYIVPKATNPYEWLGVVFIRHGWYQGGIFRFSLCIPNDFPDTTEPPHLFFDESIFHPQISIDSGELNLKAAFPMWKKGTHHIHHVLAVAQKIFYRIDLQDPVNQWAARLNESDIERFHQKVADSVRRSREVVYDMPESSDPNAIRFTPWDQTIHEKVRQTMLASLHENSDDNSRDNAQTSGLSWFDRDRFAILAANENEKTKSGGVQREGLS